MNYIMKAGVLYQGDQALARIKSPFRGTAKSVCLADGTPILRTDIQDIAPAAEPTGDARFHRYVLFDAAGAELACARPDYAAGDEPELVGWPVSRAPLADHAALQYENAEYLLTMKSSRHYLLSDPRGEPVVEIRHRGLSGGWDIDSAAGFSPGLVCAVFLFCRYLERENEFPVV